MRHLHDQVEHRSVQARPCGLVTAVEHGLTLVTRNIAAFKAGRVRTFNPWGYTPDAADEDADWRQAARTSSLWLKNLFVRT